MEGFPIQKIELLAPAGSADAFRAALENGADAIYLGTEEFNARYYAENISLAALPSLVNEAHARGVRIYLTVNTLLQENEMERFLSYLYQVCEAGIDAMIVQDPGVIHLARKMVPQLPLHASTQMVIHNTPGVRLLEEWGFKRAVLAREVSLENMKEIKKNTSLELEMFVHGALCVSYSGLCYLSSMIGGRSGNRGRCAQPCRLGYELWKTGEKKPLSIPGQQHLLSTMDIRMISHLPAVIAAGASSLKIEGRMKRPEYVAVVTSRYREAIDAYYENPDRFTVSQEALRELDQTFHRGTGTGHYFSPLGREKMSFEKPNNAGYLVGKVVATSFGRVAVRLTDTLSKGDGYLISNSSGFSITGEVKALYKDGEELPRGKAGEKVEFPIIGKASPGDLLYKTRDRELHKTAQDTYSSQRVTRKKKLHVSLLLEEGKPIRYRVNLPDGEISIKGEGGIPLEKALNRPLTREVLWDQLDRLGNTPFILEELQVQGQEGLMVPLREINQIRKDFVGKLEVAEQERFPGYSLPEPEIFQSLNPLKNPANSHKDIKQSSFVLSVAVGTLQGLEAAVKGGAGRVSLYLEALRPDPPIGLEEIKKAMEITRGKARLELILPGIVQENRLPYWQSLLENAAAIGVENFSAGTLGDLRITGRQPGAGEHSLNVMNSAALQGFSEMGMKTIMISPELSLPQIRDISFQGVEKELIVEGNFPLMTTAYCMKRAVIGCHPECGKEKWYLKDRKQYQFPLEFDYHCHMYIYNARTLSLYRDLQKVADAGIRIFRIEGRRDTPESIYEKTKIYSIQVELLNKNGKAQPEEAGILALRHLGPEGLTSGLYFRGAE